ncbi:hypothetical protein BGZ76_002330 [Entomortierella beljakovae]|nr:hypothetical protein BGZ76_002330 [Entomortierella beljakovae]
MFSPTLSPRKPKKKISSKSSSQNQDSMRQSGSPPRTPPSFVSAMGTKVSGGLSSPISSFSLTRKSSSGMFSDSDSDISPIEDNISASNDRPRGIVLNASFQSDMDTEMLSLNKSFGLARSSSNVSQDNNTLQNEDELMLETDQPNKTPKGLSKKDILKTQIEKNNLLRTSSLPIKARVTKKYNLSELMKQSQAKLNEKKSAAKVPYLYTGRIHAAHPDLHSSLPISVTSKPRIKTVALSEDSEDEEYLDSIESSRRSLLRLEESKAALIAPRQKKVPSTKPIQPLDVSLQARGTTPMSPLSKTVSKMTISGDNNELGGKTSTSKSQRSSTGINSLKEEIRRKQAKSNLELRRKLAVEAKKAGKWMAPEEYAAEQMILEGDADDENDDENDPSETNENVVQDGDEEDDEEDDDYIDEEESVIKGADVNEDYSGSEGDADGLEDSEDSENISNEEEEEEDGDEDEDKDLEEFDAPMVKARRPNKKKVLIEDDEELEVVLINREADIDEDHISGSQSSEGGTDDLGSSSDEDSQEVIKESQDMDGNSPGLGKFFTPSMNPKTPSRYQKSLVPDSTPGTESSMGSMPSSDPSPDLGDGQSLPFVMPSDILSAKFTQTPSQTFPFTMESSVNNEISDISEIKDTDDGTRDPSESSAPKNAFDVLKNAQGLKRLRKKEAKPGREAIAKGSKSSFIEYEAEEEDDEDKGKGGIDYESDNAQDDYDLGDGMIDTTVALNSKEAEDVRKLHMKHEQDQHEKEISDLVHGIAAGNLWKRRNGQGDDLDIFDEEDMDGRFQRKKKLKVSEKFEKLADNPSTAAFARALKKEIDDDRIIFLSDPDESADEAKGEKMNEDDKSEDEDEEMGIDEPNNKEDIIRPNTSYLDEEEDEEEDEPLNTDRRKETLRLAKIIRSNNEASSLETTVQSSVRLQALPFGPSSSNPFTKSGISTISTSTVESISSISIEAEGSSFDVNESSTQMSSVDEYGNILKRSKLIRDIMDGVADPAGSSVELIATSTTSSFFVRSSEDMDAIESTSISRTREEIDPALRVFAKPRMLARQSSSFLADERRNQFLSTIGDETTGSVKDVNRRKVAFETTVSSDNSKQRG